MENCDLTFYWTEPDPWSFVIVCKRCVQSIANGYGHFPTVPTTNNLQLSAPVSWRYIHKHHKGLLLWLATGGRGIILKIVKIIIIFRNTLYVYILDINREKKLLHKTQKVMLIAYLKRCFSFTFKFVSTIEKQLNSARMNSSKALSNTIMCQLASVW